MRSLLLALSFVFVLLSGCEDKSPVVSGTVTYDGSPLSEGGIIFEDAAGKIAPDAGKITNGTFSLPVKPGSKKVKIQASRMEKLPAGKKGAMGETEAPVAYIPKQYNNETTLTAEVKQAGPNTFEFKLDK